MQLLNPAPNKRDSGPSPRPTDVCKAYKPRLSNNSMAVGAPAQLLQPFILHSPVMGWPNCPSQLPPYFHCFDFS